METTETTETTAMETTWGPSRGYGDDMGMTGMTQGQCGDDVGTTGMTGTTWGGDHGDNGDHSHGDHMGTFWGLWG